MVAEAAPKSRKAVETLSSADQSPNSTDDFQVLSRGRQRINVQRQLLESINESEGGSNAGPPKKRTGSGAPAPARKKPVPHKSAPARASQVLLTDEQTQDVSGQLEAQQMEFRVGARAQTNACKRGMLHACFCCGSRGVCVICVLLTYVVHGQVRGRTTEGILENVDAMGIWLMPWVTEMSTVCDCLPVWCLC